VQQFVKDDGSGADGDEGIGQIEDGEGPCFRIEKDVVDHVAEDQPVDEVAERTGNDQGVAEMREVFGLAK